MTDGTAVVNEIKAISLWQPWASLIAFNEKAIETRSWGTDYRGPLAIHATQSTPLDERWEPALHDYITNIFSVTLAKYGVRRWSDLPQGSIVAVATLAEVVKIEADSDAVSGRFWYGRSYEATFGNYDTGRFMWCMKDVYRLEVPILWKGARGLWDASEVPGLAESYAAFLDGLRVRSQE